MVKDLQI